MTGVHQLSRTDARRIAVRAQLLTKERPTDLIDVVRRLWLVQLDPTAAVAPSADLVLWSRLGSSFDAAGPAGRPRRAARSSSCAGTLKRARGHRAVPRRDGRVAGHRSSCASGRWASPRLGARPTTPAGATSSTGCAPTGRCRRSELPDTCVVPWPSSGWNNNRNVRMMLDLLVQRGEVAAAGGTGQGPAVGPGRADLPRRPAARRSEEALRLRNDERRLPSLGIARAKAPERPFEPLRRRRGR